MLEHLFDSLVRLRLLKFFIRNPNSVFTQTDLAKKARLSAAAIKSHLKKLSELGFIKSHLKKNQKVFLLNPKFPLYPELKNLIEKAAPAEEKKILNTVKKAGQIKLLILAGVFINSYKSRADLLIVGDKLKKDRISRFFKNLGAEIGKELNYVILTTKEFRYRQNMFDRFLRDVLDFPHKKLINKLRV